MRLQIRSLASLSGLRIQHCHELLYSFQTQLRSRVAVAVVEAGHTDLTLSLGTSICHRCGPKNKKKKTKNTKTKKNEENIFRYMIRMTSFFGGSLTGNIQKFLGRGWKLGHSSDNAGSLTH